MADLSNVDSERIQSAVTQLGEIMISVLAQMGKIGDAIGGLDKGWISPVKADFMARYQKDEDAMTEMMAQFQEFTEQLNDCAKDFQNTEDEISQKILSLK